MTALQGGVPTVLHSKIIEAIGVLVVLAMQEEVVAMGGAAAVFAR